MVKLEDLRIGQKVWVENKEMEIIGLRSGHVSRTGFYPCQFPVTLKESDTSEGDYTLECISLTKPKKKVKREFWINTYPKNELGIPHKSREAADEAAKPNRLDCIRFEYEVEE